MKITPSINGDRHLFYIPKKFIPAYEILSEKYLSLGRDIIESCNNLCKSENKALISCWNIFMTACLSHQFGDFKKAAFLHNYVVQQCELGVNLVDFSPTNHKILYTQIYTDNPKFVEDNTHVIFTDIEGEFIIDKPGINIFNIQQTKSIIAIALPTGCEIIQISFNEGFLNELFTDTDLIKTYKQNIQGNDYTVYWYYSPTGAIDDDKISFVIKSEMYNN